MIKGALTWSVMLARKPSRPENICRIVMFADSTRTWYPRHGHNVTPSLMQCNLFSRCCSTSRSSL